MAGPELRRLAPHDPLPERGPYVLVLRRFGEDDPAAVVTEMIIDDGRSPPRQSVMPGRDVLPAAFDAVVHQAAEAALRHHIGIVYAVDRTEGERERSVLEHGGDHSFGSARLEDTDPEDGEAGTDLRDRRRDAGYF